MYSGYGITFHGKSTWQFGNELAKDVVIFGVENSSSSFTSDVSRGFSGIPFPTQHILLEGL